MIRKVQNTNNWDRLGYWNNRVGVIVCWSLGDKGCCSEITWPARCCRSKEQHDHQVKGSDSRPRSAQYMFKGLYITKSGKSGSGHSPNSM